MNCQVFRHLCIQCFLLDKQGCGLFCNIGIGHCYRIAFHITTADIEEPHQIIQFGQKQCIGTVLRHLFSGLCQFFLYALTGDFLIQYGYFSGRKIRSVCPDALCQILLISDADLLLFQYLFVFFAVHGSDNSAIKS